MARAVRELYRSLRAEAKRLLLSERAIAVAMVPTLLETWAPFMPA